MSQINKLSGMLVYVIVDRAVDCYEKNKGKEWKAGVVITDEDLADAWDEQFPKQAARKVKVSQFEEIYKVAPPETDGKNVWVVTLKKNEKLANGEPVPEKYRPRVFEKQGNSRVDITFSKLVANGSYGTISVDRFSTESYGDVARLQNILVTDLIEYERTEGSNYESGSEFDEDENDAPVAKKTAPAKEEKAEKRTPAKTKPAKETPKDEFGEDDPF